jgi:hypothetical protein
MQRFATASTDLTTYEIRSRVLRSGVGTQMSTSMPAKLRMSEVRSFPAFTAAAISRRHVGNVAPPRSYLAQLVRVHLEAGHVEAHAGELDGCGGRRNPT